MIYPFAMAKDSARLPLALRQRVIFATPRDADAMYLSPVTSRRFALHQHRRPLCFDNDLGDFSDLNGPHPQGMRSSA